MDLGTGDTQRPSVNGTPDISCLKDKQESSPPEADVDSQCTEARTLALGQTDAIDTKGISKPDPPVQSRFQLLPAEIRQMIYNYVWSEDWLVEHRVLIRLVSRDWALLDGQPNIMEQYEGTEKPIPRLDLRLRAKLLVRGLDPHLTL